MSISLSTNLNSLKAQGTAKKLNENIQNSTEKIASGSRIIHASDDAASLAISEKLKANIRSEGQSTRNANDAINVIQSIEGQLNSVSELVIKMKELSIQASNGTLSDSEREMTDISFQASKNEIMRITSSARLNKGSSISGTSEVLQSQLIDRAPSRVDFRIGGGSNNSENIISFRPTQLMMSSEDFNISSLSIKTSEHAQTSLSEIDKVLSNVSYSRASLGALQNRIAHAVTVGENSSENASSANSRMRDLDFAQETAANIKNKIVSETNLSVQMQANNNPQALLKLLS